MRVFDYLTICGVPAAATATFRALEPFTEASQSETSEFSPPISNGIGRFLRSAFPHRYALLQSGCCARTV